MFQNDITDPYGAGNLVGGNGMDLGSLLKMLQFTTPAGDERAPIPYSPEGWQAQKLGTTLGTAGAAPEAAPVDKKKAGPMLTADQSRVLAGLVGSQDTHNPGTPGAALPGRGPAIQMGQLQQPGLVSAPRRSLGNLIYGKG